MKIFYTIKSSTYNVGCVFYRLSKVSKILENMSRKYDTSFYLRSKSNMAGVYEDASELEKLIHECGKYMIIHYSLVILH